MKTPILLLAYKRPALTQLIFNEIRKAKPEKLFIAVDGPKEGEEGKCKEVRSISTQVDWKCSTKVLFQTSNIGGKWGGYSGINWFFKNVEQGIILEDDDLPDPSFFPYCEELLNRYRNDARVGAISGDNFQFGKPVTTDSYYYSKYFHGWGWASWARVWETFDLEIKDWPELRNKNWAGDFIDFPREYDFWTATLDRMHLGYPEAWDYQFSYHLWKYSALTILPSVNLVTNIGLTDSTHVMATSNPMVNQKRYAMEFPIKHPEKVVRNKQADINEEVFCR